MSLSNAESPRENNRKVPAEVLREIFLKLPKYTFDVSKPPWTLTRVCRFWRQTALNEPNLWTDITFGLTELSQQRVTRCVQLLNIGQERALGRLLRVQIHLPKSGLYYELSPWEAFFHALQRLCARWFSLEVISQDYVPLPTIFSLPTEESERPRLDCLEVLSLHIPIYAWKDRMDFNDILTWIAAAPRVRSLTLEKVSDLPASLATQLNWAQLTFLNFSNCWLIRGFFSEVAPKCIDLETFILDDSGDTFDPALPVPTLPKLHTLQITNQSDCAYLTMPSLHTLSLPAADLDVFWVERIINMVDRSSCHLRSISIHRINLNDLDLETVLRTVGAQVVELTLKGQLFSDYLFTRIADTINPLLPKLKLIKIVQDEHPDTQLPCELTPPLPAVLDAARSRRVSLDLEVYPDNPDQWMVNEAEISDLKLKNGIDVRVKWQDRSVWEGHLLERLGTLMYRRLLGLSSEILRNFPIIYDWLNIVERLMNSSTKDNFEVEKLSEAVQQLVVTSRHSYLDIEEESGHLEERVNHVMAMVRVLESR
ncbi:hypothetical protein PM082_020160 [Marasmius tenuissimus]|nr:hypothetical protein PM082_020160 [Marasmius tenuissimus]